MEHHILQTVSTTSYAENGKPEVDFFRDQDFVEFRGVLDAEMKRLKACGIGSQKRQAEPLSLEEEEL